MPSSWERYPKAPFFLSPKDSSTNVGGSASQIWQSHSAKEKECLPQCSEWFQRKIAQRGLATTEWIFLLPWGIACPALHAQHRESTPGLQRAQGQGLSRTASAAPPQRHKWEERAPPLTNATHHKPTQSHGRGHAVAGLLKLEGLQGDRAGWLCRETPTKSVLSSSLQLQTQQIHTAKKYPWKLTLGSEGRLVSALCWGTVFKWLWQRF